jgi:hypothetical protein
VHAGQIQCESSPRDDRHQKQIRRKTKEVKKTGHGPSGHTQCHGRSADYILLYYTVPVNLEEIPSQPFSELAGQQYIIHLAIVCVKRTNYFSQCRFAMENHFVFASIFQGAVFSKNSNKTSKGVANFFSFFQKITKKKTKQGSRLKRNEITIYLIKRMRNVLLYRADVISLNNDEIVIARSGISRQSSLLLSSVKDK